MFAARDQFGHAQLFIVNADQIGPHNVFARFLLHLERWYVIITIDILRSLTKATQQM
jgi:hypothetical protein